MKAADEPAYLTVGTDVSAKYRGAFCEAKIKTVKRLVKVKVIFKHDSSTQVVQDDQVKGPLRLGALVEVKGSDGSYQEAAISKLTDASWYTVVFDDGDERTLRRTSLCLKGERHFAESETLDQLPLTNPEHFGTPVIGKKTNRGRRLSSAPAPEDEREEEPSEDEDDDKRRLNDELLGKVVYVDCNADKRKGWYPALVLSPSCSDEIAVKKDQCLVRSFADSKFYPIARKDIRELNWDKVSKPDQVVKQALEEAHKFYQQRIVPESWKVDMSVILESSSSDEEEEEEEAENDEEDEEKKQELEEELDPEERDNFLQQLYKFMEDRGTPINKPPVLGYKDLNLFKLFRLVYRHGGCDNIDSGSVWKQIYMDLGIPILNSAASYNVKTAYKKYLYGFEEYCRAADLRFRTIHHMEPIEKPVEKDEENGACDPKKSSTNLDDADFEKSDDTENDKEEKEVRSPRGRRRNATPAKKEVKEIKKEKVNEENNKENREAKEDSKKQDKETDTGQQKNVSTPKNRAEQSKKEESEKDSEEEEEDDEDTEEDHEERQKKEGNENKEDDEEEEEEEDDDEFERFPSGTKVKVKYGRGKNQKIYEANIRNSEVDDGQVVYLVHYYGWNTRYDEWVKGDRILWPSERGAPKGKHRRKLKNKQDHEKKEDDKQSKSKRGRPSLKSPPTANLQRTLSRTPGSEGKSGTRSMRNNTSDSSPLLNGVEGLPRRRTRRSSGMYDSDKASNESTNSSDESEAEASADKSMKEEVVSTKTLDEEEKTEGKKLKGVCMQEVKELPCEDDLKTTSVKQEVESIEQTDNDEKMATQAEDIRKEFVDKSPKGKGRRSRTRDMYSENNKTDLANHIETERGEDVEKLESSEVKQLPVPRVPEEAISNTDTGLSSELRNDEKKSGKRKSPEQLTPDKRLRMESEEKMQTVKDEDIDKMEYFAEECKDSKTVERFELENGEASPLEIVQVRCVKQELEAPCLEIEEDISSKTDEAMMPPIGPEALVCHEVDLDDFDEKEKSSSEDIGAGNSRSNSPESVIAIVTGSVQQVLPIASPALLHQDEVRSVKSESDITIEVDSVAGESQEGLCESESANGFDASTSSSSSIIVQEADNKEKGQKRISDSSNGTPAKKQKRSHKRSNVSKNEKNGTGNSSDSEDLAVTDNSNKCTPVKSSNKSQKHGRSPSRVTSPNGKDGDKDKEKDGNDGTSPRTYKWSFQLTDLNNLTSGERITFLQDKLQEIRKYYMSLKSEVASIDRRRKRLKKKEREVIPAAPGTSSASSETGMSPTSSSPAQNSVAVECR
ncbi:AT-rich interactive domain-containing protein 4A isoform X2 [Heterodontus francisci]|uniref:AT-rich interactive domain-containing protein 4A isoform X2 n=1 Tax=Heterodontus francisci TaxID=7792 RepID=UPI00355AEB8F